MKKLALVLALTLTAFAGSAFAQWSSDNVGVYFDEFATTNCGSAAPYTPFPAFLVLTQLTSPDVNAWEIALTYENVTSLEFLPRGMGPIDVGSFPGEHIVGLALPILAVGGKVVVADMQLLVTNSAAAGISCNGVFLHTLPQKVPAVQGSETAVRELRPISAPGQPILVVNNGCAVDAQTTSFGEVKSLFR